MSPEMNFNAQDVEQVTAQDILEWIESKDKLAKAKAKESILRAKIIKYFFRTPVEGTNKFDLGHGYGLKFVHKLQRDVDVAMFTTLKEAFIEKGIVPDTLVETKLALKVKNYKDLDDEKREIFNQCVTTKPASGTLEYTQPKPTE